jgi:origin recognition complex subunit 1
MPHRTYTPTSKAQRARQYLTKGGVTREDSDDELGLEDHPWEWIYSSSSDTNSKKKKKKITGAKMGSFSCVVGDVVFLKAEGNGEAWVGIICEFMEDEEEGEKCANFMWFSSEREIRNKAKKRTDFLWVCES